MRSVFDTQSVASLQQTAITLSQGLSKKDTIYLFLDTPGGDIQAGTTLITTLAALPQQVATITQFAASMGFITAQSLGPRYILPGGILMSHRAKGGVSGQIPGELNSRADFFTKMLDDQDAVIANRVGMTKQLYQASVINELWVYGQRAVDAKIADRVILVRCDKSLTEGRVKDTVNTFFGPVRITYSGCPLVAAPLELDFSGLNLKLSDDRDRQTLSLIREMVLALAYDKRNFYNDYVLTNKYKKVLP